MFKLLGYIASIILLVVAGYCACKFGWFDSAIRMFKNWIMSI